MKFSKKKSSAKPEAEDKKPAGGKPKFMKGKTASEAMQKDEAAAEARREAAGKAWRFRLKYEKGKDNETQITFLDGELDSDGVLDVPFLREHTVKKDGRWSNIPCVADEEGYCPLCEQEDKPPSLVAYFTILDHTPYTDKNGKEHTTTKRLFVAKAGTLKLLTKHAIKRGGLTGITFDVSRTGDKEAAVGNVFDFIDKSELEALAKDNDWSEELIEPLNYEDEIEYYTGEQLVEMGFGDAPSGPGNESGLSDEDLSNQM